MKKLTKDEKRIIRQLLDSWRKKECPLASDLSYGQVDDLMEKLGIELDEQPSDMALVDVAKGFEKGKMIVMSGSPRYANNKREQMLRAFEEKHGPSPGLKAVNEGKHVVFDRDEARFADKSEIVEMMVVLDGDDLGLTKVCGTLDGDVIERNMRWMGVVQCGKHRVMMAKIAKVDVDKDAGIIWMEAE